MKKLFKSTVFGISVSDIFILLLVLSVSGKAYSQIDGKFIMPSVAEFKGDVVLCEENEYSLARTEHYVSGVPVTEVVVNKNIGTYTLYKADKPGVISEITRYRRKGAGGLDAEPDYRLRALYDNSDRIISIDYYLVPGSEYVSLSRLYTYDSEGKITKSISKNSIPSNTSTITDTYYWSDGKMYSSLTNTNNGTRSINVKKEYSTIDGNGSYKVVRDDGTVESVKLYNNRGMILSEENTVNGTAYITKYNDHGFVESEMLPEYGDAIVMKYSDYVYDSHGNWIKRKTSRIIDGEEIPNVLTERVITYRTDL